jgi:predicted nuclease of predicted toxin-antitoxin system
MRFLIDQDVYAATTHFLKSLGHDTVTAAELGLAQASDETLLRVAAEQKRILVTRDRDYGALVFLKSIGTGVLYLRVLPSTQDTVHAELANVLGHYSEHELAAVFVVIEPAGHRIRRLQGSVTNPNTPPRSS